jgi:hypothetical protein
MSRSPACRGRGAEVVQGAAEVHAGEPPVQVRLLVERRACRHDELHAFMKLAIRVLADEFLDARIVPRRHLDRRAPLPLQVPFVEQQRAVLQAVDAAEAIAAADRPVHRRGGNSEHALDFIEQFERVAPGMIELVDEGKHRQAVTSAHLVEFARL